MTAGLMSQISAGRRSLRRGVVRELTVSGDLIDDDYRNPKDLETEILKLLPVGYWKLDERTGDAIDSSGRGNDGTVTGGTRHAATLTSDGKGASMEFDGASTDVTISAAADFNNLWDSEGAVSVLVDPDSDGEASQGRIADKKGAGSNAGWRLYITAEAGGSSKLAFDVDFSGTDGAWVTTAVQIANGATTHIVVVYDSDDVGNDPIFWINGAALTVGSGITETTTPVGTRVSDTASDLVLGNNDPGSTTFDGHLQHAAPFDKALTPAQVAVLYAASKNVGRQGDGATTPTRRTGVYPTYINLLANGSFEGSNDFWTINSATGTNTTDEQKFGKHSCYWQPAVQHAGMLQKFSATAGNTYTVSGWFKRASATAGDPTLHLMDGSDSAVVGSTSLADTTDWQYVTATGVAGAGESQLKWQLQDSGGDFSADGKIYVDGAQAVEGSVAFPFRDYDPVDYQTLVLADSPAGYWALGEGTGNASDSSGNGNTGTVTIGAGAQGDPTLLGRDDGTRSMEFDGAATKIVVADDSAIQNLFDGGGSYEWWANPDSDGELNGGRLHHKSHLSFFEQEAGGNVALGFLIPFSGTDGQWRTAVDIPINTDAHIVITYNADAVGNNPTVYVNSVARTVGDGLTEVTTPTGTRTTDAGTVLTIGDQAAVLHYDGHLQHVAVYSDVLTAAEVLEHYNAGQGNLNNATTAGRVQVPSRGMSATAGAVFTRVHNQRANTSGPTTATLYDWRDGANDRITVSYDKSGATYVLRRRSTASAGADETLAATWGVASSNTVGARWTSSSQALCINGGVWTSDSQAAIPTITATEMDLGSVSGSSNHMEDDIVWVAFYGEGGADLTDDDSAGINRLGADIIDPLNDLPRPGDLVGFWDGAAKQYIDLSGA